MASVRVCTLLRSARRRWALQGQGPHTCFVRFRESMALTSAVRAWGARELAWGRSLRGAGSLVRRCRAAGVLVHLHSRALLHHMQARTCWTWSSSPPSGLRACR